MKRQLLYDYMNDDDLLRITKAVRKVESTTEGEICVSIKEKKSFPDRNKSIQHLAEKEFFRQKVNKTKFGTGVLIYMILQERQFYILADKGINEKVPANTWETIKDSMQDFFKMGEFSKGIKYAVEQVGEILSNHFPIKPGDKNELSDAVRIN
jgi:uncharacterized membrane protein